MKNIKGGNKTITIKENTYEYSLKDQIGHGSFGAVYIATNQGNKFALKIVNSTANKDVIVENEMNILNKLQPVCNDFILCVSDYAKIGNFHYIITEYLEDYIELFTYILDESYKIPTDDQYIIIIDNLCRGLKKIHDEGIAHRDIKPENIMINPITLDIKYIDFGHSCSNDNTDSIFNAICNVTVGTEHYYDPFIKYPDVNLHKLTNDHFNILQKSDIWSLGITIFVLISKKTSEHPFNPIQASGNHNKFKEYIAYYISRAETPKIIKDVMDEAASLYTKAIEQQMCALNLVNAFSDITTPNNLSVKPMSIMRRSHSFPIRIRRHSSPIRNKSIKRSHSSPIRNRSIKRSRNSSIQRRRIRSRTSQKKSIS
jgi:serine/threonine protein kinase